MAFVIHIVNEMGLVVLLVMLTLDTLRIPFAMTHTPFHCPPIYNKIYPKPPNNHENVLFSSVNVVFAPKGICPIVHAPLDAHGDACAHTSSACASSDDAYKGMCP